MISVVIITHNEGKHIAGCIKSLGSLTDDIIVVDAESNDETAALARTAGARVVTKKWEGYGHARNAGALTAKNDWIFALDADERCTPPLIQSIQSESLNNQVIYLCHRRNWYHDRFMRFGSLAPEWKPRLYHRHSASWDLRPVHEEVACNGPCQKKKLNGDLLHYAYEDYNDLRQRMEHHAKLYDPYDESKKNIVLKCKYLFSPYFHFIRSYIFQLGWMEGRYGWETSKAQFYYTQRKYVPPKRQISSL